MILSFNALKNKNDSSDGSVKEENYQEIQAIIKEKKKADHDKNGFSQHNNLSWEENNNVNLINASQISQIEYRNSNNTSSMSRGEECIQKDVLLIIEQDSIRKNSSNCERKSSIDEEKIIDISNASYNSQKSKNYILKSSLMNSNENSRNNSNLKDSPLKKCYNYYLPKQNNNGDKGNDSPKMTLFKSTNPMLDGFNQQQEQQFAQEQFQGMKNQLGGYQNEVDMLNNQLDYLSLQQNETNMNSYPAEYQNNIIGNNGMIPYTLQAQQDDIKIQFYKQNKARFDSVNILTNDKELISNCLNLSKEQAGCRLLQKRIDENPLIANDFYSVIKNQLVELSCDAFGNYLIQKIIAIINIDKIEEIVYKQLPTSFRIMGFNAHGTRVIQKIFERITSIDKLRYQYIQFLKPLMMDFIVDSNASHIIIQYVSRVQSPHNDFIIDFLAQNTLELATQKHSCCALQKCIEYVKPQQKKQLMYAVANNSFKLFTDQFGNYVVQFVISACDFEVNHIIMVNFLYDFKKFSIQKYSSNVIEKCLSCCSDETKDLIVEHMCSPQIVQYLLFDMYGNYVLQKGMMIAHEPARTVLFNYVGANMERLQLLSFGPKLYNRLISSFPDLIKHIKGDKRGIINYQKQKIKNYKGKQQQNMPKGINQQPLLNSFQNFGNVFYQANPIFNQYQQMPSPQKQQQQHMNPQMNNYAQMQYMQQVLGQGMYHPMQNNGMNNNNMIQNLHQGGYVNNGNNNTYNNNYY